MLRDLYAIARPSGRGRLAAVIALGLVQAVMQALAVFSVMPLLAAAADMARFRHSRLGGWLVDAIGGGSDRQVLIAAGFVALAVLAAGNLIGLASDYARSRYAFLVGHRVRVDLLRRLLERRYEYFVQTNTAFLLKALTEDSHVVASQLVLPALDVIARLLLVLLLTGLVMFVEPLIVIGGAALLALYYLAAMRPIHRRTQTDAEVIKHEMRGLYFHAHELIGAAKPILATDRAGSFVRRLERVSRAVAETLPKSTIHVAVPRIGLEMLVFGGMIVWLIVALATGGDLVALLPRIGLVAIVAYRLMPSVQALVGQTARMTASRPALEEVSALFAEQAAWSAGTSPHAGQAPVEPLRWEREIRFDNVGFAYAGASRPAIHGVSFTVAKGERMAIVGPTGSGKSTLIDLFLGLLLPTEGQILVDGDPLTAATMPAWRRAIGYVPQELFLLDGTIAENIAFGLDLDAAGRERVAEVAELAQAREFIEDGRAHGFDATVGERGVRLSGGQRQRLALARALYGLPNLLLLDEATSALDSRTEDKVVAALAQAHERLTTVTVTHRLNTVTGCDRIYYLEHGRIVVSGDYASLIASHTAFRDFAQ